MRFETLTISNLRCLERIEFSPGAQTNLVCGANGSGKTSVLEAFALASWGKSFLSNRSLDIVRNGSEGLSVGAYLASGSEERFFIKVRKRGGETAITLDGMPVAAASVLAQRVPLLVINSKAADILTESPSNRRALIDRTLFHVEPAYVAAWKNYRQALRQRNELLRRQAPRTEASYWNEQLVAYAVQIDSQRQQVVSTANQSLKDNRLTERLGRLKLNYSPGWKRGSELIEQMEQSWDRDLKLGHTSLGIHRADLSLTADDRAVARKLSRGQGKYIVSCIFMALAEFIQQGTGHRPIILIDDLAAELDDKMRDSLVDIIDAGGGQRIYTAIRPNDLQRVADQADVTFHVEHQG